MDKKIQYDSLNDILNYKVSDMLPFLAGILFVCAEASRTVLRFIIPSFLSREWLIYAVQDGVILILSFLSIVISIPYARKKNRIWPVYVFVFGSILFSILFYPEYNDWFHHQTYGLSLLFFHMTSAIFGFLIFSLFYDKKKIITMLLYACRINVFYHMYEYSEFIQRGYFLANNAQGELIQQDYGLNFGYRVVISLIFFLVLFVYNKKIIDLIFCIVSFLIVLLAGSRGAFVCIGSAVLLLYFFSWKHIRNQKKLFLRMIFLIILLIIIFHNYTFILNELIRLLEKSNISGRIIQMLLNGTITNDSGREGIYSIALEMIRHFKPFGYGFYGDRYVIGRNYYWGYPHNLFLELLIQYGVILGGFLILILLFNIIRMIIQCNDKSWQLLLITMLCSSMKLMLSDSFWYYWPFWALIAILGLWNKEQNDTKKHILSNAEKMARIQVQSNQF